MDDAITNFKDADITLSGQNFNHLRSSGKWAKILGMIGLFFSALFLLSSVFSMLYMGTLFSKLLGFGGTITGYILGGLYIGFAIYLCIASLSLYRFGSKINATNSFDSQVDFDAALMNLNKYFKLVGIGTLVILTIYVIAILVLIVFNARMF